MTRERASTGWQKSKLCLAALSIKGGFLRALRGFRTIFPESTWVGWQLAAPDKWSQRSCQPSKPAPYPHLIKRNLLHNIKIMLSVSLKKGVRVTLLSMMKSIYVNLMTLLFSALEVSSAVISNVIFYSDQKTFLRYE